MRILFILLCLLSHDAWATITLPSPASNMASRTTCLAPCAIYFSASSTTSDQTTHPFHDVLYEWNFGDTNAGTWSNGTANQSKNYAIGPEAAHVFDTAGTYTVTLRAMDANSTSSATITVTVNAWPLDATTICVENGGGFSGCPSGATQVSSSDIDATLTTYNLSNRRILFKRGDTFIGSTHVTFGSKSSIHIGAYGTGATYALWTWTGAGDASGWVTMGGTSDDVAIYGIDFNGGSITNQNAYSSQLTLWTNFLIYGNSFHGFLLSPAALDNTTNGATGYFVIANTYDCTACTLADPVYTNGISKVAVVGNYIDEVHDHGHSQLIRLNQVPSHYLISNNSLTGGYTGNAMIDIRAQAIGSTTFGLISNNSIAMEGQNSIQPGCFADTNGGNCVYDLIVERNYLYSTGYYTSVGVTTGLAMKILSGITTIRDNIIAITHTGYTQGFALTAGNATTLGAKDIRIYNNTYSNISATGSANVVFATNDLVGVKTSTGNIFENNLVYVPTLSTTFYSDTGTNPAPTVSNNTCGTGSVTNCVGTNVATDPSFATASPASAADYRISTSSYAATGGLSIFPNSIRDFFGCEDSTGAITVGALVPKSRAICFGSAH